ncbi:nitroreductase family protein [Dactylosporangium sp. NPDC049140]|uniref:nitroreductase family protein n=1 Tax=Dactylosporangium sp. NPDC049140 TaxID=3155647 RepID=UPI0033C4F1EF
MVPDTARPVPLRDFGLGDAAALPPGPGDDAGAEYLVVATGGDEPLDWLAAGEATSAAWLAATAEGLAASPMSDVVEIPGARALIRSLLPAPTHPQLVLRVGVAQASAPPSSPRRPAAGIVTDG